MKFELCRASSMCVKREVEINSIEELLALAEEWKDGLILSTGCGDEPPRIMVYDTYIE